MVQDQVDLVQMGEVLAHATRDTKEPIVDSSDLDAEDGAAVEVFGQHAGVQCQP
jgi:hypothetical protein